MNIGKELLLVVATTLVSTGVVLIQTDTMRGAGVLIAGAVVFVGRGFYKKYLDN